MRVSILMGVAAAGLLTAPGFASLSNHIDLFVDGDFFLPIFPGSGMVTDTQIGDLNNILGGERHVALDFAPGGANGIVLSAQLTTQNGLSFDNGAGASGILELTYGMNTALNADFDTDYNFFEIDFNFVDGMGSLEVIVEGGGVMGSAKLPVNAAGAHFFSFDNAGFAGVDFFDVDKITLRMTALTAGADFGFSSFTRQATPAPGALALFGLAGLGMRRRRRSCAV